MSDTINLVEELIEKRENICILGPAGSGKSYLARYLLDTNNSICAAASTGIAAVNIGGVTLNSLLNFYDIGSLRAKIANGAINQKLIQLSRQGVTYILIDEVSMISAEVIDLLLYAETTRAGSSKYPIRFILIGDPGQLPSINAAPFFEASLFHHFKIIKLEYIHRQKDIHFISALNLVRQGKAEQAVDFFFPNKEEYTYKINTEFKGPTIFATNKLVDAFNLNKLNQLSSYPIVYNRIVIGTVPTEWLNTIPPNISLKLNTRVMLLKNKPECYANGDIAIVLDLFQTSVLVELIRNKKQYLIEYIDLNYRSSKKDIVVQKKGTLSYLPVRQAYATTLHKIQGMTCEYLQFDIRNNFIKRLSGGLYTGLSRCKTLEGLNLIGSPTDFVNACFLEERYMQYL